MLRRRIAAIIGSLLLLTMMLPGAAFAGTNSTGGVTLITPNTYGSCTATGDTIRLYNGAAYARKVTGQVIVQYVVGADRVTVPGGFYAVNTIIQPGQTFELALAYPPSSQWPLAQSSVDPQMRELHIDVQLEVWQYEFARPENWLFMGPLGYGLDWDIFCRDTPPPPSFQGCTPGYYKNHATVAQWGGIDPSTKVSAVFNQASSPLANYTLLQALSFQGGSTLEGASEILLRAGVAAYINANHPGVTYPISGADVVVRVNGALASNDRATIINMASELDSFNNLGCPLGK